MSQDLIAAKPLNARQRRFAEELPFKRAEDAYVQAGFKAHRGNCQRLARDPRVQAIVEQVSLNAAKLAGVHLGRVLIEQSRIAYFNIGDVLKRDGNGKLELDAKGLPIVDYALMTHEHFAAVAKIDLEKGRIEFHDKVAVLRDLARILAPASGGRSGDDGDDKPPGAGGTGDLTINVALLQMVKRFEGMSDLDIARRIAFTLHQGSKQADKSETANG